MNGFNVLKWKFFVYEFVWDILVTWVDDREDDDEGGRAMLWLFRENNFPPVTCGIFLGVNRLMKN